MAVSMIASGVMRISGPVSTFTTFPFSAMFTASVYQVHQFQIANGVSDFILSLANLSNPGLVIAFADQVVRLNYGGESSASGGSAGRNFKDLWAQVGSGISGPLSFHFANSSGNAASVTVIHGI